MDVVKHVECYYIEVPDRLREGAKVLNAFTAAGVKLLASAGHAVSKRRAELDLMLSNPRAFRAAAKKAGFKVEGPDEVFLVQGKDRFGARRRHTDEAV